MSSIEAGKLNRKIQIQQLVVTESASGHPAKSWTLRAYAWASVRPLKGVEAASFGREQAAQMMAAFEIRFNKDVSFTDRIVYDGYNWEILSIAPWGRLNREMLQIFARVLEGGKIVN